MRILNPFHIPIILVLLNTREGSALLMHGNSNISDVIHATAVHTLGTTEIKQMFLNLTVGMENLKRQSDNDRSTIQVLNKSLTVVVEEKKLLQNRVFFLEAEMNKLNVPKPISNVELVAFLRRTRQIVQTLAANEEYVQNLTQRLNEAENNMAICARQNKNLTQRLDDLVNNLLMNDNQDENLTQQFSEVVKDMATNEAYAKNLSQGLRDTTNILHNLKVQMRYTNLSMLNIHSETEKLNAICYSLDVQIRAIHGRFPNFTKKLAFTASMTTYNSTKHLGKLVFDKIIYNIGGGYDPLTGVFTSPVDGHFVFFLNVQANSHDLAVNIYVILNGQPTVNISTGGITSNATSNLVALELQKGDRVWVRYTRYNMQNGQNGGHNILTISRASTSTFSGFLI